MRILILALTVWLIYLADHFLDGTLAHNERALKARHLFWRYNVQAFGVLAGGTGVAIFWLVNADIGHVVVHSGVILAGVVAIYMLAVHLGGTAIKRVLPKEILVGLIFAAGTTLPVWSRRGGFTWDAVGPWALFGLLCCLNCIAIECWEGGFKATRSPFLQWADARLNWLALGLALAGVFLHLWLREGRLVWGADAVAIAAVLTMALNGARRRLSSPALRVLADVALLAAAVCVLLTRL